MPLTPFQRASIKRHLGYPLITATETLRSGMLPSGPDDLTFAMEKAFDNVIPEAEKMILTIVEKLVVGGHVEAVRLIWRWKFANFVPLANVLLDVDVGDRLRICVSGSSNK